MKKYLILSCLLSMTSVCAMAQSTAVENNSVYLIFAQSQYYGSCDDFVEWKRQKGFQVHDLYDDWSEQSILNTISDYDANGDSVKYVLLVGNDVPGHQVTRRLNTYAYEDSLTTYYYLIGYNYTYNSDYYYECRGDTSSSAVPAIRCGRIPVDSGYEAEHVLAKIIDYEQNPTSDASFYKTFVSCAAFDAHGPYEWFHGSERGRCIRSSENICNYMSTKIDSLKVKKIYLHTVLSSSQIPSTWTYNRDVFDDSTSFPVALQNEDLWYGDTDAINDSINAGTFLMTYLGDGFSETWEQRQVAFAPNTVLYSADDTVDLVNNHKYPVLLSMSKKSGKYDETADCPAEFFLKKENGGAVAVIAPSEEAYPGYKEYLAEGFVNAIWPSPGINNLHAMSNTSYELGDLLAASKEWIQYMNFYNLRRHEPTFGTYGVKCPDYYQYHKEVFHLYGDPSMMIYTEKPTAFTNVSVSIVGEDIVVNTGDANTKITFYTPECEWYGEQSVESFVGSSATHWFDDYYERVIVCVDKHNKIPYVTEILWEDVYDVRGSNNTARSKKGKARCVSRQGYKSITSVPEVSFKQQDAIYDLTGRRIDCEPARGMYIRNGRIYRK
ncbi:MAG: hypothetical protein K5778_04360 [Bacteroidaceae bacterium]|nr:hypothetical protein [Bacteroidaceae bacterium]